MKEQQARHSHTIRDFNNLMIVQRPCLLCIRVIDFAGALPGRTGRVPGTGGMCPAPVHHSPTLREAPARVRRRRHVPNRVRPSPQRTSLRA